MAKWKVFHRSKTKEETDNLQMRTQEKIKESEEKQVKTETRKKYKETPVTEYNETLYSDGSTQNQPTRQAIEKKKPWKRTTWENTDTIEHYVDTLHWQQKEPRGSPDRSPVDTDKKVDYILLKKKSKT